MILRQKEGKLLVNLINRGSGETFAANRNTVENLPPIENVVVSVRRERSPQSVTMVPPDIKITWAYNDGILTVKIPQVDIHRVLVIE